eukprot:6464755-Amphidinium_carterae.1
MFTLQCDVKSGVRDPTFVCKYIAELCSLHSAKKAASAFVAALRMLETIGGVQDGIAENVLVKQTVKDAEAARLVEGGRLRPKRAPQMSVGVLTSLELHVMSRTLTSAERRVSWIKAVQIWSALRAADMFAVQIKHLSYTVGVGLQITLTRTKTSGEAKPIHVLEAYVDDRATLSETEWLQH